ncbi:MULTISPECIES: peptidylprolyl isomerase [Cupriavidus]|uniref:Peptidyl-prolyl cis-trans isomerase n=2 Tax=Cupriavidus basilensis TaxID=68895 RepID=A0A0C4Y6S5_9BURK|nr:MULTISPECIES: peptidylprolyl isomerase [Cupriavidus]AJG18715.1 Peptidyl-prolyl cis-trans isomerase PpiA precursor [Cupriavidus basilensis]EHP38616.1 peptidyl-prolyl cis-trans isomerase A [Cupriavidus basilensis OR16]MBB1629430.1 peptidylprolyl isomerase [Cupriavidus sp. UME77]NUA25597.1 peptidyl-prolyl cis-trans isomerase [Cupriavidus basilensis]QOT77707.1 peptidyl-prolyl cis-trans isomerase [Cupriavidus basilensis]
MIFSRRLVLAGIAAAAMALSPLAAQAQQTKTERVQFVTSAGKFTLEVYPDAAPKTVANFMEYVKSGFYSGTIFHRVINGFMVQGGGFDRDMKQKPTRAAIPLEAQNGLKNKAGTVAMARTSDPNSATAQFFINVVDNSSLDYPSPDGNGYAVFGKVVEGMDTVDKMKNAPTTSYGPMRNVPATPIVIESATVVK